MRTILRSVSLFQLPSRVTSDGRVVGHVANHNRAGTDHRIRTNPDTLPGNGTNAEPRSRADLHISGKMSPRTDVHALRQQTIVINCRAGIDDARFADPSADIDACARHDDGTFVDTAVLAHRGGRMNDGRTTKAGFPGSSE